MNSANSRNVINDWSMDWVNFRIMSVTCVLFAMWRHIGLLHKML